MTPKEKAEELVNKMYLQMPVKVIPTASTRENQLSCDIDLKGSLKNAKQCALIAVDEIIKEYEEKIIYAAYDTDFELWKDRQNYWEEVKQEIEKL